MQSLYVQLYLSMKGETKMKASLLCAVCLMMNVTFAGFSQVSKTAGVPETSAAGTGPPRPVVVMAPEMRLALAEAENAVGMAKKDLDLAQKNLDLAASQYAATVLRLRLNLKIDGEYNWEASGRRFVPPGWKLDPANGQFKDPGPSAPPASPSPQPEPSKTPAKQNGS
jgi:hypothetical protein